MNENNQPAGRGRPISLVVVALLWVVGIPTITGACLFLYKAVKQPPDNLGLLVLIVGVALAYLIIWPCILYQAVATRRRGQPLQ